MQWYYGIGNQVEGPVEDDGLLGLVRSGVIGAETLVWATYLGNWTAAWKIDGLFAAAGIAPSVRDGGGRPEGNGRSSSNLSAGGGYASGTSATTVVGYAVPVNRVAGGNGQEQGRATAVVVEEVPVRVAVQEAAAPVPRVRTGALGLTEIPAPEEMRTLNTAGVALNPSEHGGRGSGEPAVETGPIAAPASVVKPLEETFRAAPTTGADEGAGEEFAFSPTMRESGAMKAAGWRRWALPGLAAVVILGGGAALADRFVLGGSLFGFGSRPTGPHRYFPDEPKLAMRLEVRDVLLSPYLTGNPEASAALGMVDQMMQSAVGLRPYDIHDVSLVGTDLSKSSREFVCVVTTTKKIPEDKLVEKLFGESAGRSVGGRMVYEVPMSGGFSGCVADENTFLIGGKTQLEQVLKRTREPEFSEEELVILNSISSSEEVFSMGMNVEALLEFSGENKGEMQQSFLTAEDMKQVRTGSLSVDFGQSFEISYGVSFDTEENARSAYERVRGEFAGIGVEGDTFSVEGVDLIEELTGGVMADGFDPKVFANMNGTLSCRLEGKSLVVDMGMPMEFLEKLVSQGMAAGGAAGRAAGGGSF